jgi:hypothetical protein
MREGAWVFVFVQRARWWGFLGVFVVPFFSFGGALIFR